MIWSTKSGLQNWKISPILEHKIWLAEYSGKCHRILSKSRIHILLWIMLLHNITLLCISVSYCHEGSRNSWRKGRQERRRLGPLLVPWAEAPGAIPHQYPTCNLCIMFNVSAIKLNLQVHKREKVTGALEQWCSVSKIYNYHPREITFEVIACPH